MAHGVLVERVDDGSPAARAGVLSGDLVTAVDGRRWSVRIADATSIPHGDDTRPRQHQSGFGYGTLTLFVETPGGDPTAYGWYGLDTRIDFRTHIALGRAVR